MTVPSRKTGARREGRPPGVIPQASSRHAKRVEGVEFDVVVRPDVGLPALQSPFLLPEQAAEYLHVKASTLANWRMTPGKGPRYRKHGRSICYTQAALDAWSALQEKTA